MSKAAELAALIGSQTALSNRNLIINGAMNVAQRSTSETGLGASSGYHTIDRFRIVSANTAGRFTMSQASVTDLPGFANALKLDCTTADTSIAAAELATIQTKLEGQNLQQLKKGTSSAEAVTVSFYMKTNKAFTFMCEFDDNDNNIFNGQQFTTSTSWTRHSITFVGDTTGTLDDDNAKSAQLNIHIHGGADFTGGTYSADTWQSRASTDVNRAVGIGSFFDSTDNEIQMTGLQMEIGEVATPFEHRSFADELARCQRYFYRIGEAVVSSNASFTLQGRTLSSNRTDGTLMLPSPMRAVPSVSVYESSSTTVYPSNESAIVLSGETYSIVGNDSAFTDLNHVQVRTTDGGTITNGHSLIQKYSGAISLDAEL